jgi:hypothetical protein
MNSRLKKRRPRPKLLNEGWSCGADIISAETKPSYTSQRLYADLDNVWKGTPLPLIGLQE